MHGFGFATGHRARAPGGAWQARNAETLAYLARQAGHGLSAAAVRALDDFVGALKAGGLWTLGDQILWLHPALPNRYLNLLGEGFPATPGGGLVDVADNPATFSAGGSGAGIAAMASSSGVRFQQNSASLGVVSVQDGTRASAPVSDSTARNLLSPYNASHLAVARVNASTTLAASAAVSNDSGFLLASRTAAAASTLYKGGVAIGSSTAASQLRTANPILFGANAMPAAYALTWIGAGLDAAQAAALCTAADAFMAAVGVHALTTDSATAAMAAAHVWPDVSGIGDAGKGLPCTGLAALPDGRWLVGVGLATISDQAGVAIVSADFSTLLAQYSYTGWGMTGYSTQGVTVDGDGNGACIAKNPGTEARLVRFDLATGALVGDDALPYAGCNALTYDSRRDRLVIGRTDVNRIDWYDPATLAVDATIPSIAVANDQLCYHAATDSLLVTGGANGADGYCYVYTSREYGAMWRKRALTMEGSLAIEGVAVTGDADGTATLVIADDGHTHGAAYDRNRAHVYAGVAMG